MSSVSYAGSNLDLDWKRQITIHHATLTGGDDHGLDKVIWSLVRPLLELLIP